VSVARFSLKELLSPVTTTAFLEGYWETKLLVVTRGCSNYFGQLLKLEDISATLSALHLCHPQVSVVNAAQPVDSEQYVGRDGVVDRVQLFQKFADGSTIILNQMQDYLPALARLCRALGREVSARCHTNIYLTPANAQGFKPHYDDHDVFVLQINGSKRWRIYQSPVILPMNRQEHDSNPPTEDALESEFNLEAGDTLYIPRGIIHEARSGAETSLHITLGVLNHTWAELLLTALAEVCLNDPAFRRALPFGFAQPDFDRFQAGVTFRDLLHRLSTTARLDSALESFVEQLLVSFAPDLDSQMTQIERLPALSSKSIVRSRSDLIYRIRLQNDTLRIGFGRSEITLPGHVGPAVGFALEHGRFAVHDLPGELDANSKLVLVRRLVREGLLEVLHELQE
jgi:hypothetical protein